MQARVDGVDDAAGAAHAVVQLEVAVAVPGQRAHAGIGSQAHTIERMGQLAGAARCIGPGVAVNVPFHTARHDLGIAMVGGCKFDQRRLQQRLVLHQAQH